MRIRKLLSAFLVILACATPAFSQNHPDTSKGEDLMGLLDEDQQASKKNEYVAATFKATRIINGHSIENVGAGVLDFRISHRFGPISGGIDQFFGLDGATTKLGLDYGINNWLMVGIGRSTYQKEVDGFFKAKLLRQTEDNRMPVSLSLLGACGIQTAQSPTVPAGTEYYFSNRVAYTWQVLVARKFTRRFSAQFMPSIVHMNLVQKADDPNNVISLGIGGRYKLSRRLSLTAEYYYNLEDFKISGTHNALAFGLDIETGGHVFQLFFTNSTGISERTFIANTTDQWSNGDIHFGFNISRVFTIVKPKDMEGTRNKIW